MLIDDLIEYCDEQYQNGICEACTAMDSCTRDCDGNCKNCLDDIHFHYNQRRTQYNCSRLLNYYVCRYSYKYCSEIIYALNQLDLSTYPYFHDTIIGMWWSTGFDGLSVYELSAVYFIYWIG